MKKLEPVNTRKFGVLNNKENRPEIITFDVFGSNEIIYADGNSSQGTCLNCILPPCMNYKHAELDVAILPEMPQSNITKVCPSEAIKLNPDGFPEIYAENCFGCGLCVNRCIYGAINLDDHYKAKINKTNNDRIEWTENFEADDQNARDDIYLNSLIEIEPIQFSKEYFVELYQRLSYFMKLTNGFDNLFVRNLLINLGVQNKVRAVGNNDIRFDLIGELDEKVLIGEIGLNNVDILEEPRALLDDIAILHSRYNINSDSILPLIITLSFPNKRSDVYEVIYDIEKILNIKIITISVHILIALNIFKLKFNEVEQFQNFYVDKNNKSISQACLNLIPGIEQFDPFFDNEFYQAVK